MKPLGHFIVTAIVAALAFFPLHAILGWNPDINLVFVAVMFLAAIVVDVDKKGLEAWWMTLIAALVLGFFAGSEFATSGGAESLITSVAFALLFAGAVFWFSGKRSFTHYGYTSSLFAIFYGIAAGVILGDPVAGLLAAVLVLWHTLVDYLMYDLMSLKHPHAKQTTGIVAILSIAASFLLLLQPGPMELFESMVFFAGSLVLTFGLFSLAFSIQRAPRNA